MLNWNVLELEKTLKDMGDFDCDHSDMEIDKEESEKIGIMDALPEEVVEYILSFISNAKDWVMCSSVCRAWKDSGANAKNLHFPRSVCEEKKDNDARALQTDKVVGDMVMSTRALEELTILCPFTHGRLGGWLTHCGASLRRLELRLDSVSEGSTTVLDSVGNALCLESLTLWGACLAEPPAWVATTPLKRLHTLEIIGIRAKDSALTALIQACPMLAVLALLGCDGVITVDFDLQFLEQCRMDFYGLGDCCVSISAPKLQSFEVQGASWIRIRGNHCLTKLAISNNAGKVYSVACGNLSSLESLTIRGVQWTWDAICTVLRTAMNVQNLVMKIEFSGDTEALQPFPQIDFVDFFNSHLKLIRFEAHGAMFAALSQKSSLVQLKRDFSIPCLEEMVITVRSPLNPDQKIMTLESIVKHSRSLRKLVVRVLQMKNCEPSANKFFEKLIKFYHRNEVVKLE